MVVIERISLIRKGVPGKKNNDDGYWYAKFEVILNICRTGTVPAVHRHKIGIP